MFTEKEKNYMGMLTWSKGTCSSPRPMFGTEIATSTPITITISTAIQERGLSKFWFHRKKNIVELELTPVQWAEFLTSGNSEGVPCTLRRVNGQPCDSVESEDVIDLYDSEMTKTSEKVTDSIKNCMGIISEKLEAGKTLNKTELKDLLDRLAGAKTHAVNNTDFVKQSFREDMAMSVAKAKAEVSAYCENRIQEIGLDTLKAGTALVALTYKDGVEQ